MAANTFIKKLQPYIDEIAKVYVQNKRSLPEVLDYVQEQYNVQISASSLKRCFNHFKIQKLSAEDELTVLAQNLLWHDLQEESVTILKWKEEFPEASVRDFLKRRPKIAAIKAVLPRHLSIVPRRSDRDRAQVIGVTCPEPECGARFGTIISFLRGFSGHVRDHARDHSRALKRCRDSVIRTKALGPLHYAAQINNVALVQQLLENGASVNGLGQDGSTAIIQAARYGSLDVLKILLVQPDADINIKDMNEEPALITAIENDHADCALLLIEKGANVVSRSADGQTPLYMACARAGMDSVIEKILQQDITTLDDEMTEEQDTALYRAIAIGNRNYAKMLMKAGCDVLVFNYCGQAAIREACMVATEDFVLDMIKAVGAGLDTILEIEDDLLHLMCKRGHTRAAEAVIMSSSVDINVRDFWDPPLILATVNGHYDTVEMLLNHGADRNVTSYKKETAYGIAIKEGNIAIAQLLGERCGPADLQAAPVLSEDSECSDLESSVSTDTLFRNCINPSVLNADENFLVERATESTMSMNQS